MPGIPLIFPGVHLFRVHNNLVKYIILNLQMQKLRLAKLKLENRKSVNFLSPCYVPKSG
jgi:hypothetical protein